MNNKTVLYLISAFILGAIFSSVIFVASLSGENDDLKFGHDNFGLKFDKVSDAEEAVVLIFNGENYDLDFLVSDEKSTASDIDDVSFIAEVTRGNTHLNLFEFSRLWAPKERQDVVERGERNDRFNRNKNIYNKFSKHNLMFAFNYKGRRVFVVKHYYEDGTFLTTFYPSVQIAGEYYLTNSLEDDVFIFEFLKLLLKQPFMENWEVL